MMRNGRVCIICYCAVYNLKLLGVIPLHSDSPKKDLQEYRLEPLEPVEPVKPTETTTKVDMGLQAQTLWDYQAGQYLGL